MNWQQETRAWALASAGVFCLFAIGLRVLTAPNLPDLNPAVAQLNGTISNVNHATQAWSAASAQQVASVQAIERDLRVELWHVDRVLTDGSGTLSAAQGAIGTLNGSLSHVAPLLDSLKASSDALPPVLESVREDADALTDEAGKTTANANGAVTDLRRFITAPALTDTLSNAASMTQSGAAIIGDGRKVADKETADFLKPVPWYMKPVKRFGEVWDITAAVARHVP